MDFVFRQTDEAHEEVAALFARLRKLKPERAGEMIPSPTRGAQQTQQEIAQTLHELRTALASIRRLVEMLEKDPSSLLHGKSTPRNGQP